MRRDTDDEITEDLTLEVSGLRGRLDSEHLYQEHARVTPEQRTSGEVAEAQRARLSKQVELAVAAADALGELAAMGEGAFQPAEWVRVQALSASGTSLYKDLFGRQRKASGS